MRWIIVALMLVLTACQPDPTPFPVNIPSVEPTLEQVATAETPATLRYALAANTVDAIPDMSVLVESADVEFLTEAINPADLGTRYDIIATYGSLSEGTTSPVLIHVSLIVSPNLLQLSDVQFPTLIRSALDARAIVNTLAIPGATPDQANGVDSSVLRTELANAGYPDGMVINAVSAYAPGIDAVQLALESSGIESHWTRVAPELIDAVVHRASASVALVTWTTTESRTVWENVSDPENVIDLFTVPITYLAIDGLTITFSSSGFPLATR